MTKVKIKGTLTDVRVVDVELFPADLVRNALPHMTIVDIETVLKNLLEAKFRENDPSIPKNATIDWYWQRWEKYSFTDYHKNDDIYDTVRDFNEEEQQYVISMNALFQVFK